MIQILESKVASSHERENIAMHTSGSMNVKNLQLKNFCLTMTNQFKNMVSNSGECHQVNPLTGFAANMSGAVEKMRAVGSRGLTSGPTSRGEKTSQGQIDVREFESLRTANQREAGEAMFSQWADGLGQGVESFTRPAQPYHPVAPMMGLVPQQSFYLPAHAPQVSTAFPSTAEASVAGPQGGFAESVNDDLAAAKRMVEVLRNSGNPKFANCTFVDFIDQVAQGDLKFRDGQVVDREGKPVDWDSVYEPEESLTGGLGDFLEGTGDDAENLPDQMERIWNELRRDNEWLRDPTAGEYKFQHSDNPYIDSAENPLEVALRLIREGKDAEAIVALEAEVRLNQNSSEGWRLLGQLHAQFDRDVDAIKCLEKGHECDAYNLDSIMALGVSLTNELDSVKAMEILKKWIGSSEKFHHLITEIPLADDPFGMPDYDFSRLKRQVMDLFNKASQIDPNDSDVAIALGVLHNIDRNYAQAIDAFLRAVELRATDFTAWNKLGATMANAGLSREALECYHQALALKPNYARAWSNLAIAHTNLEEYDNASRFFLAALQLSPEAQHLWSSLVIALSNWQPENASLSDLLENRDLKGLVGAINGAPKIESLPKPVNMSPERVRSVIQSLRAKLGA
jgi:Flp pilus assembly protein TadD